MIRMLVIRELGSQKPTFVVSTGNGNFEFDVVSAFAEKYDGRGLLWFPKIPKAGMRVIGRRRAAGGEVKGLPACRIVNTYPGKYGITSFVFLMDAEHVKSAEDVLNYFSEELRVRNLRLQEFEEGAFLIEGSVGAHKVRVHTAVLGETKCIEENVARLVEIELKIPIDVEGMRSRSEGKEFKKLLRKAVMEALRRRRLSVKDLIDGASVESLERAFPSLSRIFKIVEKESLASGNS